MGGAFWANDVLPHQELEATVSNRAMLTRARHPTACDCPILIMVLPCVLGNSLVSQTKRDYASPPTAQDRLSATLTPTPTHTSISAKILPSKLVAGPRSSLRQHGK